MPIHILDFFKTLLNGKLKFSAQFCFSEMRWSEARVETTFLKRKTLYII